MTTSEALQPARRHFMHWLAWARRLFLPLALSFLAYSAYHAGDHLLSLLTGISIPGLVLACLCWVGTQWIGPLTTTAIARIFNVPLSYRELALISIRRIPAKYLPGGIWQSVARFVAYRSRAVKNTDSFAILLIEHLVALGASAALGSTVAFGMQAAVLDQRFLVIILCAGLFLLVAATIWAMHIGRRSIKSCGLILLLFASAIFFWCFASTAFLIFWMALFGFSPTEIPTVVSAYLLSWAAGFAAVFAPQGVGVFEWTAAHLVPTTSSVGVVITAMAGFRIVIIIGDMFAWASGIAVSRISDDTCSPMQLNSKGGA